MKTLFFGFNLIAATLVQFDTQDQIYKEAFECKWIPQLGWENDAHYGVSKFGVERFEHQGASALRVKSTDSMKAIRLNKYPYSYKVTKVAPNEFIVTSSYFDTYWSNTDNIEILFLNH